jgi:predicted amidohydrolase
MLGEPPQRPLRVAAIQAEAVPGDVPANVATAARLTERAAADGAAIAVFPELFVPAYHPPTLAARPADCDVPADAAGQVCDARLAPLKAAAADLGVAVLIGASVRHPGQRRTISLLLVAAGQAAVAYDKQHLWGTDEPRLFSPGQRGTVLSCSGWRLGLGICYDVSFPEHARSAALAGAHAYVCPSVFLVGRDHRRDVYFPARALENTMYAVFTNGVGGSDAWRFSGRAGVFDPQGRTLCRAPAAGEAVVCADMDPGELVATRAQLPMLADCLHAGG